MSQVNWPGVRSAVSIGLGTVCPPEMSLLNWLFLSRELMLWLIGSLFLRIDLRPRHHGQDVRLEAAILLVELDLGLLGGRHGLLVDFPFGLGM